KRVRLQTFGNFEAYIDGKPMAFKYSKTKEVLAYLIDRKGALCTLTELQAILFEDDYGHESYMKSLRRDLLDTLEAVECEHIISQQRGKLGIVPEEVDCDYYDWCNGKRGGRVWNGEYMAQYSWSEYTAGVLERMSKI
ncbi:MAG: two-component system response regulator, partial [Peptococcaceae bacterium]|nr:two-component system response regulator [Peptococcaceae bacterium]